MATIDQILVGEGTARRHVGQKVFAAKVPLPPSVTAAALSFLREQEADCYLPLMGDVVTAEMGETWLTNQQVKAINDAMQSALAHETSLVAHLEVEDLCMAGHVAFHNDSTLVNEDDGLTFVLVLKDSSLEFAFADGRRFPLKAGDFYLFDLALPHAVLPAGARGWTEDWLTASEPTASFEQSFMFAAGFFPPTVEQLPYVGAQLAQAAGAHFQFGGLSESHQSPTVYVRRSDGMLSTP